MPQSTFEHLKESYDNKPVLSHFGMEVLTASEGQATMRLPFSERGADGLCAPATATLVAAPTAVCRLLACVPILVR